MTRIDYFVLPWYKKVLFRVAEFFKALGMGIAHFFMSIPGALAKFFKKFGRGFAWLGRTFVHGGILTKLSYIVMGAGSLFRGQIIKGLMYLAAEVAYFGFMIDTGFSQGFGTSEQFSAAGTLTNPSASTCFRTATTPC